MTSIPSIEPVEHWYAKLRSNTNASDARPTWIEIIGWERNYDQDHKPVVYAWLNANPPVRSDKLSDVVGTHTIEEYQRLTPDKLAKTAGFREFTWPRPSQLASKLTSLPTSH